jgi:hypothetical protein
MTSNQEKTISKIIDACSALGFYRFECKSSYHDDDAERNLSGKTHYVDPDTMRFFSAKTLCATHCLNLFYIIEQSQAEGFHGGRVRKVTVFNIFGTVVEQSEETKSATESKKTFRAYREKYSSARYAIAESKQALRDHIKTMRRQIKSASSFMAVK